MGEIASNWDRATMQGATMVECALQMGIAIVDRCSGGNGASMPTTALRSNTAVTSIPFSPREWGEEFLNLMLPMTR